MTKDDDEKPKSLARRFNEIARKVIKAKEKEKAKKAEEKAKEPPENLRVSFIRV